MGQLRRLEPKRWLSLRPHPSGGVALEQLHHQAVVKTQMCQVEAGQLVTQPPDTLSNNSVRSRSINALRDALEIGNVKADACFCLMQLKKLLKLAFSWRRNLFENSSDSVFPAHLYQPPT
jgi:hypothetical protein